MDAGVVLEMKAAFHVWRHEASITSILDFSLTQSGKINAKLHDGVCQHCKGILEWRVKFSKYKLLSKPKKCVKCLQKTVKDPYHIICRPCAGKLEVCAKCGKEEEIVIPINKGQDRTESVTTKNDQDSSGLEDKLNFDANFSSTDSDEDSDVLEERFKSMNFQRTEI
ncbi:hypothetical protein A306_00007940 [Columba livia]|uniref:Uncharacterized protein n=1 Tax=Columba livia TaxID=8932 RepID=A0A2I0MFQ5_COLLI|nr:uncharacterized protein C9orf85 homolog [Columba livia]PKK28519.1 hypothetical protein A306_00007940 [Columba livia]